MKQQVLSLTLPQEKTFQNFFGAKNQAIIAALKSLTSNSIYLWGKKGAGVTHLLQACCLYHQKQGYYVLYLDLAQKPNLDHLLQGALEGVQLIALDHLDSVAGKKTQEELLFNLYNRSLQTPF